MLHGVLKEDIIHIALALEINNGLMICYVQCENVNRQITLSLTYSSILVISMLCGMNGNWNLTYSSEVINLSKIQINAKQFSGQTFNAGICGLLCIGY